MLITRGCSILERSIVYKLIAEGCLIQHNTWLLTLLSNIGTLFISNENSMDSNLESDFPVSILSILCGRH